MKAKSSIRSKVVAVLACLFVGCNTNFCSDQAIYDVLLNLIEGLVNPDIKVWEGSENPLFAEFQNSNFVKTLPANTSVIKYPTTDIRLTVVLAERGGVQAYEVGGSAVGKLNSSSTRTGTYVVKLGLSIDDGEVISQARCAMPCIYEKSGMSYIELYFPETAGLPELEVPDTEIHIVSELNVFYFVSTNDFVDSDNVSRPPLKITLFSPGRVNDIVPPYLISTNLSLLKNDYPPSMPQWYHFSENMGRVSLFYDTRNDDGFLDNFVPRPLPFLQNVAMTTNPNIQLDKDYIAYVVSGDDPFVWGAFPPTVDRAGNPSISGTSLIFRLVQSMFERLMCQLVEAFTFGLIKYCPAPDQNTYKYLRTGETASFGFHTSKLRLHTTPAGSGENELWFPALEFESGFDEATREYTYPGRELKLGEISSEDTIGAFDNKIWLSADLCDGDNLVLCPSGYDLTANGVVTGIRYSLHKVGTRLTWKKEIKYESNDDFANIFYIKSNIKKNQWTMARPLSILPPPAHPLVRPFLTKLLFDQDLIVDKHSTDALELEEALRTFTTMLGGESVMGVPGPGQYELTAEFLSGSDTIGRDVVGFEINSHSLRSISLPGYGGDGISGWLKNTVASDLRSLNERIGTALNSTYPIDPDLPNRLSVIMPPGHNPDLTGNERWAVQITRLMQAALFVPTNQIVRRSEYTGNTDDREWSTNLLDAETPRNKVATLLQYSGNINADNPFLPNTIRALNTLLSSVEQNTFAAIGLYDVNNFRKYVFDAIDSGIGADEDDPNCTTSNETTRYVSCYLGKNRVHDPFLPEVNIYTDLLKNPEDMCTSYGTTQFMIGGSEQDVQKFSASYDVKMVWNDFIDIPPRLSFISTSVGPTIDFLPYRGEIAWYDTSQDIKSSFDNPESANDDDFYKFTLFCSTSKDFVSTGGGYDVETWGAEYPTVYCVAKTGNSVTVLGRTSRDYDICRTAQTCKVSIPVLVPTIRWDKNGQYFEFVMGLLIDINGGSLETRGGPRNGVHTIDFEGDEFIVARVIMRFTVEQASSIHVPYESRYIVVNPILYDVKTMGYYLSGNDFGEADSFNKYLQGTDFRSIAAQEALCEMRFGRKWGVGAGNGGVMTPWKKTAGYILGLMSGDLSIFGDPLVSKTWEVTDRNGYTGSYYVDVTTPLTSK